MFIAQDDVYAIVLKEEGKVIGSLGLHARFPDESLKHLSQLEVGYVIHPAYWGFGYAPEAVNRVIQYCFEERDLDLLWCGHFDFNEKSRRVIEKCNFSYQFTRENTLPLLEGKKVMNKYYHITKDRYFNVLQHI